MSFIKTEIKKKLKKYERIVQYPVRSAIKPQVNRSVDDVKLWTRRDAL